MVLLVALGGCADTANGDQRKFMDCDECLRPYVRTKKSDKSRPLGASAQGRGSSRAQPGASSLSWPLRRLFPALMLEKWCRTIGLAVPNPETDSALHGPLTTAGAGDETTEVHPRKMGPRQQGGVTLHLPSQRRAGGPGQHRVNVEQPRPLLIK